ncbi:purine-nucleoside phosphorylase [Pseudorhodoferax sp.]|uniref:purine-nucleoside phosphorylase n=1 Tax=Pseudorhodoferax sp. TaxID=1993553 RepID=UPI002DD66B94|nr:purine-nucleoside phosphorylase [Pseudorhodoferax sp.]
MTTALATATPATIASSTQVLAQRLGTLRPQVAIVLGSGWGAVADQVQDAIDVPYADLPAFPRLGVAGHAGLLRAGRIGGRDVLVLAGRKHAYETGEADGMKGVIRTLAAFGVTLLIQTNAAGSADPVMRPGELMLISDHLNLVQRSPLFGDSGNDRFVDMNNAYDAELRRQARAAADAQGLVLHEGVYAWFIGPHFETPAEIRMVQRLGAQAVGMSTVPETILARHAGLKVLALSLFTNMAAGIDDQPLSHAHTLAIAKAGEAHAVKLMQVLLASLQP